MSYYSGTGDFESTDSSWVVTYYDKIMLNDNLICKLIDPASGKVLRGLMDDDFQISIENTWGAGSNLTVSSAVTGFLNNLARKMGPHVTELNSLMGQYDDSIKGIIGNNEDYNKYYDVVKTALNKGVGISQLRFVSGAEFFKSFDGTNINMPMSFRTTWITDCNTRDIYEDANVAISMAVGDFTEYSGTMVGMINPPNGYKPTLESLNPDEIIEGTLNLKIGNNMIINNLVISSLNFTVSNSKVETLFGIRPLFITAEIGLTVAKLMTKGNVENLFKG